VARKKMISRTGIMTDSSVRVNNPWMTRSFTRASGDRPGIRTAMRVIAGAVS